MNLRSKFIAITGSALILASSITMGAAQPTTTVKQDTADAVVTITGGHISVSVEAGTFPAIPYSLSDSWADGSLTLVVDDMRGTALGWDVKLSATNFVPATGTVNAVDIPVGNLALAPESLNVTGGTAVSSAGVTSYGLTSVTVEGQKVLDATNTNGEGVTTSVMDADLKVPAGTVVGTYTSVVTVDLTAAP